MSIEDVEKQAFEVLKIIGEELNYSVGEHNGESNYQAKIIDKFQTDEYENFIRGLSLLHEKGYVGVKWTNFCRTKVPFMVWLTAEGFDKLNSPSTSNVANNETGSISLGGISNSTITGTTIVLGRNNTSSINQGTINIEGINSLSNEEKHELFELVKELEKAGKTEEGVWEKVKPILRFLLDKSADTFIAVAPYIWSKIQALL